MKKLAVTKLFLLFVVCSAFGQQNKNDFYKVAFKTQQTLSRLADSIHSNNNEQLISPFTKLEASNEKLYKILDDFIGSNNIDSEYIDGLSSSQKALDTLIYKLDNTKKVVNVFEAVNSDYETKIKSIDYGMSTNINAKVKVEVQTLKETGYFAFMKYSYDDTYVKRFEFNNPTNNTQRYLAPGYYIVWIEKGDYKSKERLVEVTSTEENIIFYFNE
ncbi:hypothetical protein [Lacinutrix chionoecetis]